MRKWRGAWATGGILLGALAWACTEGGAPGDDAGIRSAAVDAGVGGSGSTAVVPVWTAGAGPKDLPSCTADSSSTSAAELAAPPAELGLAGSDDGPFAGIIGSISADRMTVNTPTGIVTVGWRGPSLAPAFAVGDSVRILRKYVGGFGAPRFTTVHSARATAVAFNGSPYTVLGWSPGSTATLRGLEEGLPVLKYEVGACCGLQGYPHGSYSCDYSALQATFDGSTAAIARGATGVVGPWSITNVASSYYSGSEYVWHVEVSLLGPATPWNAEAAANACAQKEQTFTNWAAANLDCSVDTDCRVVADCGPHGDAFPVNATGYTSAAELYEVRCAEGVFDNMPIYAARCREQRCVLGEELTCCGCPPPDAGIAGDAG